MLKGLNLNTWWLSTPLFEHILVCNCNSLGTLTLRGIKRDPSVQIVVFMSSPYTLSQRRDDIVLISVPYLSVVTTLLSSPYLIPASWRHCCHLRTLSQRRDDIIISHPYLSVVQWSLWGHRGGNLHFWGGKIQKFTKSGGFLPFLSSDWGRSKGGESLDLTSGKIHPCPPPLVPPLALWLHCCHLPSLSWGCEDSQAHFPTSVTVWVISPKCGLTDFRHF